MSNAESRKQARTGEFAQGVPASADFLKQRDEETIGAKLAGS